MKVVRANCRIQFTAEDIAFLLHTLDGDSENHTAIQSLLGDPESRNLILDSETLFNAVLECPDSLSISLHFFFYILVRHALVEAEIRNEAIADYIAELLSEFSQHPDLPPPLGTPGNQDSLAAWYEALDQTHGRHRFELQAYFGNRLLYLTGVQENWLRNRTQRRGAPSLEFYEAAGPTFFRTASQHVLANAYELKGIFEELADRFHDARLALNTLSNTRLHLESTNAVDQLLCSARAKTPDPPPEDPPLWLGA